MHMREVPGRVARYVRDMMKDGLRSVVAFIFALALLGYALWQDYNLTPVLDFNILAVKWLTSLLEPFGWDARTEFALRAFGIDKILFFSELWAFVTLVMRAVGLLFRLVVQSLFPSRRLRHTAAPRAENPTAPTGHTMEERPMNLRPNIHPAAFLLYAAVYLALTVFVAAVLFTGYQLPLKLEAFGIVVPPFIYLAGLAFLAFVVQHRMSVAYGGGRAADIIVSAPMIAVIVIAVLVWAGFPLAETIVTTIGTLIGEVVETVPTEYKIATAILFGFFALLDVVRDYPGWGRRSNAYAHLGGAVRTTPAGDVRRADWVTGEHGDLPDRTMVLNSRSGAPEFLNTARVHHEIVHTMRDPRTGEIVEIPYAPTPRGRLRVQEAIEARPLPPEIPPAQPVPEPAPQGEVRPANGGGEGGRT